MPTERKLFSGREIVFRDKCNIVFRNVWKGPSGPEITSTLAGSFEVILHDRIMLGDFRPQRRNVYCAMFFDIADSD